MNKKQKKKKRKRKKEKKQTLNKQIGKNKKKK